MLLIGDYHTITREQFRGEGVRRNQFDSPEAKRNLMRVYTDSEGKMKVWQ